MHYRDGDVDNLSEDIDTDGAKRCINIIGDRLSGPAALELFEFVIAFCTEVGVKEHQHQHFK